MNTIGQRIKSLRIDKELSIQDFATAIGKSKGNISGYENDKYEPSAQTIIAIAKYFEVSIEWLLTGEEFQRQNDSRRFTSDGILLSKLEAEILQMFKLLDARDKEDIYELTKLKYHRSLK